MKNLIIISIITMKENINSHNLILSKIKLQEEMIWKPGKVIFDEGIFQIYVSEEYKNSSRKDTDEVYRMSEIVALHKISGLQLVYVTTEDYYGDTVTYKLNDLFIITLQQKKLKPTDMNTTKKYFITPEGQISFSSVKKDSKGD